MNFKMYETIRLKKSHEYSSVLRDVMNILEDEHWWRVNKAVMVEYQVPIVKDSTENKPTHTAKYQ